MASQDYEYVRRHDPRRKGFISVNCLKYVLFMFNFIFLVSGCSILGVGIWTLQSRHDQLSLMGSAAYMTVVALYMVAGLLTLIVAFFGCIAFAREDRCYLLMYTFGLLLIFLFEAIGGILAYVYEEQLHADLSHSLTNSFNANYGNDEYLSLAIDNMQIEYKCCGALTYSQWRMSEWKISGKAENNSVPYSCCKTPSPLCGARDHPSNIYYSGCIYRLEAELGSHLLLLGAIGLGLSAIHIVGLMFSCCLYIKLKDIDDY